MPGVKGRTNNPNGRPRKGKSLTEALQRYARRKLSDGTKAADLLAETLWALAFDGNMEAIKYLYDRIDGKPVQALEHSGEGGGPVAFSIAVETNADSSAD